MWVGPITFSVHDAPCLLAHDWHRGIFDGAAQIETMSVGIADKVWRSKRFALRNGVEAIRYTLR